MKFQIDIKAYPGDEVWLSFIGGPYKAKVSRTEIHAHCFGADNVRGEVKYYCEFKNGNRQYVSDVAVFLTEKEAEERLKRLSAFPEYSEEFARFLTKERAEHNIKIIH